MIRKSFQTHAPADAAVLDINGANYRLRPIPGLLVIRMMAKLSGNEEDGAETAVAFEDFFRQSIVPEQWEEFEAYLLDPENNVGLAELQDMAAWIVEVASGKAVPLSTASGTG